MLVLGGTWFVGRAIVSEALRRGWDVTTFTRGHSPGVPGAREILGDRERPDDLELLAAQGPWDVVVDIAGSVPRLVRDAGRALRSHADLYVFISTVSAYREWPQRPVDESSPLFDGDPDLDPVTRAWDPEAYGPLKAGCELAVRREFGDDVLILRPTATLGPHEYVGRLQWWLRRMERGGRVLAPGDPKRGIQPVDVRDLASFAVALAGGGAAGLYNVAAPIGRDSYGDLLLGCREVTGSDAEIVWVDEDWLVARGVVQWTELPLWRTLPTMWTMDASRAHRAGLVCRPLRDTIVDMWAWLRGGGVPVEHERFAEHGIEPEREARLLAEWTAKQHGH